MSEWGKIGITILFSVMGSALSASFIVWNLIQDHETRLRLLDAKAYTMKEAMDTHIRWHNEQYDTINRKLTDIQVDIGRIQGIRNGR